MSSVHFVCVSEDVSLADALANVFDEAGLSIAEDDAMLGDDDVAVLVWSEASAQSPGFMNAAQQFMDEGRAVIASFVAIADASNVGAPVFDLSDWDGKNRSEPVLVPLIYAVERRMPAIAGSAEADEAEFEEIAAPQEEVLELSEPVAAEPEVEWTPLRAAVAEQPAAAAEPHIEEPAPAVQEEAPPLVAAEVEPAKPAKRAKAVKPAPRRAKPQREKPRRVRAAAERRKYMPPPPGRLRAAAPFLAGITACIVAVFVAAPFLGGAPSRIASESSEIAAAPRATTVATVEEIVPEQFAELIQMSPAPTLALASPPPALAQSPRNPLLQLASATTTTPRRTRTPRPITSWDTPDPKRRGYLATTGQERPEPQVTRIAAEEPTPGRKPKREL